MSPAELNYSAFDCALLAAYLTVRHFQFFVEGRVSHINKDHQPFTFSLQSTTEQRSPRQARHIAFFSELTTDIHHIDGHANCVAYALSQNQFVLLQSPQGSRSPHFCSRPRCGTIETFYFPHSLEAGTSPHFALRKDFSWRRLPRSPSSSHTFANASCSLRQPALLVAPWHQSLSSSERYFWPNMKRDIPTLTCTCHNCQQSKIQRNVKASLHALPLPDRRFDSIHIDIVGPLPPSKGYTYLFTCTNWYTRWPEAMPMTNAIAESCASALLSGWVSRVGVPTTIKSYRGQQLK